MFKDLYLLMCLYLLRAVLRTSKIFEFHPKILLLPSITHLLMCYERKIL
jgi:uncharacterized membrane protein